MTAIPPPLPEVIAVEPLLDRWLRLTFAAGDPASLIVRQYDVDPWLSKGVFRALRDPLLFRQAFIQHCTVCWPGNLDIDPECLWSQSVPWVEPGPCEEVLPTEMARAGGPLIPLLSAVVTLAPVPKGTIGVNIDLLRGTLGTVVEQLDASCCLVEFAGEDGVSVGDVPLRYEELLPVHRVGEPGASAFGAANRDGGPASVTALKGIIRQPPSAAAVSVEDMAAVGSAKAVADMKAFFEEGQALTQASPCSAVRSSDDLYEADSKVWAKLQIQLLEAANWAELDVGNLIRVVERAAALVRVLRTDLGGEPPKDKPSLAQFILEMPKGAPLELDAEEEEQPGPAGSHLYEGAPFFWAALPLAGQLTDAATHPAYLTRIQQAAEQLFGLATAKTEGYRQGLLRSIDWQLVADEFESIVAKYAGAVERYAACIIENLCLPRLAYQEAVALQLALADLEAFLEDVEPAQINPQIVKAWNSSVNELDVRRGLCRALTPIRTLADLRQACEIKLALHRKLDQTSQAYRNEFWLPFEAVDDLGRVCVMPDYDKDAALVASADKTWKKTSMVLVRTARALEFTVCDAVLAELALGIPREVAAGRLESQGNLEQWMHSEVRLKGQGA